RMIDSNDVNEIRPADYQSPALFAWNPTQRYYDGVAILTTNTTNRRALLAPPPDMNVSVTVISDRDLELFALTARHPQRRKRLEDRGDDQSEPQGNGRWRPRSIMDLLLGPMPNTPGITDEVSETRH